MTKRAKKLTDTEVVAIVADELRDIGAGGSGSTKLSAARAKALDYYLGQPFGNEVDGESQVVLHDVHDTVEAILPALLKMFTSGDEVVRFEPPGPEDEEFAKQGTEYVNFIWSRDNRGFMNFYEWFKDALLQKTGTVKIWWDESEEVETSLHEGLTIDQVTALLAPEDDRTQIELLEHTERSDPSAAVTQPAPGAMPMPAPVLHDVKIRRTTTKGRVKVSCVPPEEFGISRDARDVETARAVWHRTRRTLSWLKQQGYDNKDLDALAGDGTHAWDEESLSRDSYNEDDPSKPYKLERSQKEVWVTETYMLLDCDGDGVSEMRRILTAGDLGRMVLLENEEWSSLRPFAALCPYPIPHRFHGQSVADCVMDLQLIDSTLLRQVLNNLYLTNNPAKEVVIDQVNLDDLLTSRPGGIYRVKQPGMIREIQTSFVAGQTLPVLEYMGEVKASRTGITKYTQGMDANSLNKTATGISQIMTQAQQRVELIARIFAETGVVQAFKIILDLIVRHQDRARTIRLRNQWVEMDPRHWDSGMDVTISVGLGTGNRDQMAMHIGNLMGIQKQIVELQGGAQGPLVTMENVYNAVEEYCEALGLKQADKFVTDPTNAPQQPPRPDPEIEKAKAQLEIDRAKAQQEAMIAEMKARAEIEIERIKAQAKIALEREMAGMRAQIEAEKLQIQAAQGAFAPRPEPMGAQ